jgi:hypothetical protein
MRKHAFTVGMGWAIGLTIVFLASWCGHSKPTAKQVQSTVDIATCVAKHWGEDWMQLVTNCAGQGLDLFYDIVAENEKEAEQENTDAGPTRKTLTSTPAKRKSYYATQPPIALRLQRMKDGG